MWAHFPAFVHVRETAVCWFTQVSACVPEYTEISLCSPYCMRVCVFRRAYFYVSKPECLSVCMECMKWEREGVCERGGDIFFQFVFLETVLQHCSIMKAVRIYMCGGVGEKKNNDTKFREGMKVHVCLKTVNWEGVMGPVYNFFVH